MNVSTAEYLVHFSNVLMLVSYSVRDILWLRWFAVAAALTNMPISTRSHASTWNGAPGPHEPGPGREGGATRRARPGASVAVGVYGL